MLSFLTTPLSKIAAAVGVIVLLILFFLAWDASERKQGAATERAVEAETALKVEQQEAAQSNQIDMNVSQDKNPDADLLKKWERRDDN